MKCFHSLLPSVLCSVSLSHKSRKSAHTTFRNLPRELLDYLFRQAPTHVLSRQTHLKKRLAFTQCAETEPSIAQAAPHMPPLCTCVYTHRHTHIHTTKQDNRQTDTKTKPQGQKTTSGGVPFSYKVIGCVETSQN